MKDAFDVLMITHAGLCKGYADVLKLILDIDEDDFGTLSFENGESLDDFSEAIRATIEERYKDRNLVVLLDLPGGSPANTALPFMSSSRKLIAGVNLPLVLEIMAMKKSGTTWEELDLDDTCKSAAQSIVLYNNFLNGGNVDHRLLHGQVIFSWTKQVGTNYIIVADDKVPNDPISMMALSIAKPVDCELSIIPFSQLRKLVDENASKNIMIIVKGPAEALQLAKELPEVTEINYGGVAKKAGSKEYGKAVYLNEAELKATQELISMGKKIYIQMVPSSPIEHASFEN